MARIKTAIREVAKRFFTSPRINALGFELVKDHFTGIQNCDIYATRKSLDSETFCLEVVDGEKTATFWGGLFTLKSNTDPETWESCITVDGDKASFDRERYALDCDSLAIVEKI